MKRPQLTLRTIFCVIAIFAVASLLWRSRPDSFCQIHVTSSGSIELEGKEVASPNLGTLLTAEAKWRKRWRMTPQLTMSLDPAVTQVTVVELLNQAHAAGFESVAIATAEAE